MSPTGWRYNLATTKSKEVGGGERWIEQPGGADNLNEKEKYEVEKGGRRHGGDEESVVERKLMTKLEERRKQTIGRGFSAEVLKVLPSRQSPSEGNLFPMERKNK